MYYVTKTKLKRLALCPYVPIFSRFGMDVHQNKDGFLVRAVLIWAKVKEINLRAVYPPNDRIY